MYDAPANATVHHAPLYRSPDQNKDQLSVVSISSRNSKIFIWLFSNLDHVDETPFFQDEAVQGWISTGISRDKLILGLSAYGRSFQIENQYDSCPGIRTPVSGIAQKHYHLLERGRLCMLI